MTTAPARRSRWFYRTGLGLWLIAVTLIGSALLAAHLLTLPHPSAGDARLALGLARLRTGEAAGRWLAVHVLSEGCRCSRRVLDHLLDRPAGPFAAERVLLVGPSSGPPPELARLQEAGYSVEVVSDAEAEERYGVLAAPLLVVADPSGAVRYVGGYTERKQSQAIRDREIFGELAAGREPAALPTFGCAVAARLQRDVDPLGLR